MTGTPTPITPPLAPPTEPDPNAIQKRNIVWPKVIGIVTVVLAGMGVLVYSLGMSMWAFTGSTYWSPHPFDTTFTTVLTAIHVLLSIVLLGGGVALLRRRRAAVRCLVVWSCLRLVHGILQGIAQGWTQMKMFEQINDAPIDMMGPAMALFSAVMTVLWAAALPVFFLIWFTRKRVRRDIDEYFLPTTGATAT